MTDVDPDASACQHRLQVSGSGTTAAQSGVDLTGLERELEEGQNPGGQDHQTRSSTRPRPPGPLFLVKKNEGDWDF